MFKVGDNCRCKAVDGLAVEYHGRKVTVIEIDETNIWPVKAEWLALTPGYKLTGDFYEHELELV